MTDTLRAVNDPPHHPRPPGRLHFDMTVNIPTVLSIVVMLASTVAFGVGLYNGLDARTESNTTDIAYLRRDVDGLAKKQSELDGRITAALETLRRENRDDFGNVQRVLNQLLLQVGGESRTNDPRIREWTK